jgi:hypothetical protein
VVQAGGQIGNEEAKVVVWAGVPTFWGLGIRLVSGVLVYADIPLTHGEHVVFATG